MTGLNSGIKQNFHLWVVWVLEGRANVKSGWECTGGYLECSTGRLNYFGAAECVTATRKTTITSILCFISRKNFRKFSVSRKKVASTFVALISQPVYRESCLKVGVSNTYGYLKSHAKRFLVWLHFHGNIEISNLIRLLLATLYV